MKVALLGRMAKNIEMYSYAFTIDLLTSHENIGLCFSPDWPNSYVCFNLCLAHHVFRNCFTSSISEIKLENVYSEAVQPLLLNQQWMGANSTLWRWTNVESMLFQWRVPSGLHLHSYACLSRGLVPESLSQKPWNYWHGHQKQNRLNITSLLYSPLSLVQICQFYIQYPQLTLKMGDRVTGRDQSNQGPRL